MWVTRQQESEYQPLTELDGPQENSTTIRAVTENPPYSSIQYEDIETKYSSALCYPVYYTLMRITSPKPCLELSQPYRLNPSCTNQK